MTSIQISWPQGIDPCSVQFIEKSTLCARYGRIVQFMSLDGSHKFTYHPTTRTVSLLAVHSCNHVFAVAESNVINPVIQVCDYPHLNPLSTLKNGGQLTLTAIAFSTSEYLLATSGVPDFKLHIWNYVTGDLLTSCNLKKDFIPTSISFNPTNWRQIIATEGFTIHYWTVEQCDKLFSLVHKSIKLPTQYSLPGQTVDIPGDTRNTTRASTRMTQEFLELPESAIAGVHSEFYQEFVDSMDMTTRMHSCNHVWSEIGDAFISCVGGQLLKLDIEKFSLRVLHNPGATTMGEVSMIEGVLTREDTQADVINISARPSSLKKKKSHESSMKAPGEKTEFEMDELEDAIEQDGSSDKTLSTDNNLTCMVYSKQGIYACGSDGILRLLQLPENAHTDEVRVTNLHQLEDGSEGVSLVFNYSYDHLAIASATGRVDVLSTNATSGQQSFTTLNASFTAGKFISLDSLYPTGELLVALQEGGLLQIWHSKTGVYVSHYRLDAQCASLASCPSCKYVAIGTSTGHLLLMDCSKPNGLRLMHRVRLHKKPITFMKFDPYGRVLITAADDGHLIVVDARPSTQFQVLGCVEYPGEMVDLSVEINDTDEIIHVAALSSIDNSKVGSRITYFQLSNEVIHNFKEHHASVKCDFKEEVISKMLLTHLHGGYGCVLQPNDSPVSMYTVDKQRRTLEKITLPIEPPKKAGNKASLMDYTPTEKPFFRHEDPNARLCINSSKNLVISFGRDGFLRATGLDQWQDEVKYSMRIHDHLFDGIRHAFFTPDGTKLFTLGHDGSILCHMLKFNEQMRQAAHEAYNRLRTQVSVTLSAETAAMAHVEPTETYEDKFQKLQQTNPDSPTEPHAEERLHGDVGRRYSLISTEAASIAEEEPTWIQAMELDALQEEEKKYSAEKQEIRRKLKYIRDTIRDMVQENSTLPDLEKLERQEFELDIEEQSRIMAETEKEVQAVREEIELDMLAKQFTREVIRRECWDQMKVKGRALCSFNGLLQVNNFPLRARTDEECAQLETVIQQRKIELVDMEECLKHERIIQKVTSDEKDADEVDDDFIHEADLNKTDTAQKAGTKELLYDQLSLTTREQKVNQIILLQDLVYRMKEAFNKEFDDIFQKKEQELGKIKEKNSRIKKILTDLNQMDQYTPDLEFNSLEKPEKLLTVDDSEVTVEKYLSPEQRKRLEEERLAEEERKRRERADNWRERGLDEMMGGVLEIKKEDELKKEIPKPAFMLQKPEEEWNDDEKKAAQEYERKVKELNEEREKFKKQLEGEYKKLSGFIDDGKASFDEVLSGLFTKYLRTYVNVLQEELKIWRIKFNLLQEEELERRHTELKEMLAERHREAERVQELVQESKRVYEVNNDVYLTATAEEKVMEKNFRKEFYDVSAAALEKLMRTLRKPKRNPTGQIAATQMEDYSPQNPYADKPSTARRREAQLRQCGLILHDLDEERPAEIEEHVWQRFCAWRRKKFQRDIAIKRMALELAEVEAFLKRRQAEFREHMSEAQKLQELLDDVEEQKHRFQTNLEVQLVMKQGQVEVEVAHDFIHDFTDSVLLDRKRIEDLNEKICKLGEIKVQHMMVGKDFKQKFVHMEWELRRMLMEYNELQMKLKDIQRFKITREVQRYLSAENYEALIAAEIQKLDKAIEMLKTHHEKSMDEKRGRLKQITSVRTKKVENKNTALLEDLKEMNVTLNERLQVYETVGVSASNESTREKRYHEILQRQKLVDIAKSQAKEVAVLRAEVERLRMRTFPALVQNK